MLWVETLSGMELSSNEALSVLSPREWQKRREDLAKLGGPPVSERSSKGATTQRAQLERFHIN